MSKSSCNLPQDKITFTPVYKFWFTIGIVQILQIHFTTIDFVCFEFSDIKTDNNIRDRLVNCVS